MAAHRRETSTITSRPVFHIARPDGSITGPHPPVFLRTALASEEIRLDTMIRLEGTSHWLPVSAYISVIGAPEELSHRGGGSTRRPTPGPGFPRRRFLGGAFSVAGAVLSYAAAAFFSREMTGWGVLTALLALACLIGMVVNLD